MGYIFYIQKVNVQPKILVRTPNWIGDHVMAHPFYQALKLAYPKTEIHFLCSDSLKSFPDQYLCQKKILFTPRSKRLGPEFFSLANQIKTEGYDIAISLAASYSSSLLLCAARVPVRVGFSAGGSGIFLTDSLRWRGIHSGKHKSELYLELLEFMKGEKLKLSPLQPLPTQPKKRIVVAPGASIPLRVWPYFTLLIKKLSQRYPGHEIVVVGSSTEKSWHGVLESLNLRNVIDSVEKTNLSELIELCRDSSLVIANDSGVAHLAGTMSQAPTLVLFGPGSPHYIRPLGPKITCEIPQELPCHPCEKPMCHEKFGYQACLKAISADRVLTQVDKLISP